MMKVRRYEHAVLIRPMLSRPDVSYPRSAFHGKDYSNLAETGASAC